MAGAKLAVAMSFALMINTTIFRPLKHLPYSYSVLWFLKCNLTLSLGLEQTSIEHDRVRF